MTVDHSSVPLLPLQQSSVYEGKIRQRLRLQQDKPKESVTIFLISLMLNRGQ